MTWIGQNRGHAYSEGFNLETVIFFQKDRLMSVDLINVIGTEILRSVPEIKDREFEKNGPTKIFFFFKKMVQQKSFFSFFSSRLSSLCFTPLQPKFNPRTGQRPYV